MLSPRRLVLLQTLHPDRVMHNSFRGSYVLRADDRTAAETGCSDPQLHRQQPLHCSRWRPKDEEINRSNGAARQCGHAQCGRAVVRLLVTLARQSCF